MRDFYLPAFILALPALAALGHDIYLAYNNTELAVADRFYLSDLGWLWTTYHPDSYKWATENVDNVVWTAFVDPVLQMSAVYVLGAPFAVWALSMIVFKIFGLGPFENHGLLMQLGNIGSGKKRKDGFAFGSSGMKNRPRYKRK